MTESFQGHEAPIFARFPAIEARQLRAWYIGTRKWLGEGVWQ